jgi:hypothetical protein
LEACRRSLKAYDLDLDLWWSPVRKPRCELPGRWRVVAWLPNTGNWDTVFYWEGEDGTYRDPSPQALLNKVMQCDMWARGDNLAALSTRTDEANEKKDKAKERARLDGTFKDSMDFAESQSGIKRWYDMGRKT